MTNSISISVTSMYLANECPRCFWFSEKIGAVPGVFPGVLSRMDSIIKNFMDEKKMNPPPWFPIKGKFLGATKLLEAFEPESKVTVKGKLDALVETDEGYWIVDYKTSKSQNEVPKYYQAQLDGYAFLVEKNIGKVAGGGLLYFYPKNGDLTNGNVPFDITWVKANLNSQNIIPLLGKVREILNTPSPPASNKDCEMCKWLQEAGYRLPLTF